MSLRDLLAAATPGPWRISPHRPRLNIESEFANVAIMCDGGQSYDSITGNLGLIALCPETTALLCDMAEWCGSVHAAALADREPDYEEMDALLARFAELEERT